MLTIWDNRMAVSCGMGGKLDFYYTRTYIPAHIQTHSNSKYYPNDDCAIGLDFQRMTYEIHCNLVYKRVKIAIHRQTYTHTKRHTHTHIAFYKRVVSVCLSIANMTDNGQTDRHTPTTHSSTFPSVPPPPPPTQTHAVPRYWGRCLGIQYAHCYWTDPWPWLASKPKPCHDYFHLPKVTVCFPSVCLYFRCLYFRSLLQPAKIFLQGMCRHPASFAVKECTLTLVHTHMQKHKQTHKHKATNLDISKAWTGKKEKLKESWKKGEDTWIESTMTQQRTRSVRQRGSRKYCLEHKQWTFCTIQRCKKDIYIHILFPSWDFWKEQK